MLYLLTAMSQQTNLQSSPADISLIKLLLIGIIPILVPYSTFSLCINLFNAHVRQIKITSISTAVLLPSTQKQQEKLLTFKF